MNCRFMLFIFSYISLIAHADDSSSPTTPPNAPSIKQRRQSAQQRAPMSPKSTQLNIQQNQIQRQETIQQNSPILNNQQRYDRIETSTRNVLPAGTYTIQKAQFEFARLETNAYMQKYHPDLTPGSDEYLRIANTQYKNFTQMPGPIEEFLSQGGVEFRMNPNTPIVVEHPSSDSTIITVQSAQPIPLPHVDATLPQGTVFTIHLDSTGKAISMSIPNIMQPIPIPNTDIIVPMGTSMTMNKNAKERTITFSNSHGSVLELSNTEITVYQEITLPNGKTIRSGTYPLASSHKTELEPKQNRPSIYNKATLSNISEEPSHYDLLKQIPSGTYTKHNVWNLLVDTATANRIKQYIEANYPELQPASAEYKAQYQSAYASIYPSTEQDLKKAINQLKMMYGVDFSLHPNAPISIAHPTRDTIQITMKATQSIPIPNTKIVLPEGTTITRNIGPRGVISSIFSNEKGPILAIAAIDHTITVSQAIVLPSGRTISPGTYNPPTQHNTGQKN